MAPQPQDGTLLPHLAPVVVCEGVTKSFGEGDAKVMALRGIDVTVRSGELVMLVGPSGCGKTTLISIMAGILKPDAGRCSIIGQDLARLSDAKATDFRGHNIGFIFQSFNLLPSLTLVENVAVPLIINGTSHEVAQKRAKEILEDVGLANRFESLPGQLSGGQQQRVAIARAMVHEPRLLVCDEPTSALDYKTGIKVMELIRKTVKERHATLVIITHDSRILEYADRIEYMDDGMIVDPSQVIHH